MSASAIFRSIEKLILFSETLSRKYPGRETLHGATSHEGGMTPRQALRAVAPQLARLAVVYVIAAGCWAAPGNGFSVILTRVYPLPLLLPVVALQSIKGSAVPFHIPPVAVRLTKPTSTRGLSQSTGRASAVAGACSATSASSFACVLKSVGTKLVKDLILGVRSTGRIGMAGWK